MEEETKTEEIEKPTEKPKQFGWNKISAIVLVALVVVTIWQGFQIASLKSGSGTGVTGITGGTTTSGATGASTLQQILKEITPTGTPDYGKEAGVSYDGVEQGLRVLMGYDQSISLSGSDLERYIKIATTRGTACEYCCGIGDAGFGRSDGKIACGCSHNVAFSGLTKWLIKDSKYTDAQIIEEIGKWKVLFFPQGSVEKELEQRGISPEAVGLPSMRGGC